MKRNNFIRTGSLAILLCLAACSTPSLPAPQIAPPAIPAALDHPPAQMQTIPVQSESGVTPRNTKHPNAK